MADFSNINDEVANARVTYDGRTYNSLGDAIRAQIMYLKSDVDSARSVINTAYASISRVEASVSSLQNSQQNFRSYTTSNISKLQQLFMDQEETDREHDRRINDLTAKLNTMLADLDTISANEASATTLLRTITTLRASIVENATHIQDNALNIARNRYDIDMNYMKIGKLLLDLADAKYDIALINQSLGLALSNVQSEVDTLRLQLDQIPSDTQYMMNDLQNTVAELEDRVEYLEEHGGSGTGTGTGTGGGTSFSNVEMKATNISGWTSTTVANDGVALYSLSWHSLEDGMETGDGEIEILVNNVVKAHVYNVEQGEVTIDIAQYCTPGNNNVQIIVYDVYGSSRTLRARVDKVELSLSSSFDPSPTFEGPITFTYTPVGAV